VILPQLTSQNVSFGQLQSAVGAGLQLRLFGKPEIDGTRRLGVTLAVADSVERPWRALKPPPRRSSSKGKDKKPGRVAADRVVD
jgi:formate-dependent phosphoribosylglycinamide formyltransferase (GAR transformylase)